MADVVARVAPELKAAGFRKRRQTFNRVTDGGITHVVQIQRGATGVRQGAFTINLGVYAPAMHVDTWEPPSGWVNAVDCPMERRIGELLPGGEDVWWSLDDPVAEDEARAALLGPGLAWLDRFPTPESIVRAFEESGGADLGFPPRGPAHVAALKRALGD